MQKLDFGAHVLQGTPPPGRGEATHLTVDIEQCTAALPSCLAILADHILFFVAPGVNTQQLFHGKRGVETFEPPFQHSSIHGAVGVRVARACSR